jgi:acyl-CoA synthetase (AMP-forming)/AMP-acid ligase II
MGSSTEPSSVNVVLGPLEALILDRASERGSASYLFEARGPRSLTFEGLSLELTSLRRRLASWNLGPGDRVGLLIGDPLTFATWFLAGLAIGMWVAPFDPTVSTRNLLKVDLRARALGADVVLSDRDGPGDASLNWITVTDDAPAALESRHASTKWSETGGVVLSSSGTSGTPKVVALPSAQLLETAQLIATHNRLEVTDRGFNPLPLWHVNAEVVGLLATLVAGASLVLDDRFHRTGFWKIVDDFDVTWINAVPAIISRLVALHDDEAPPKRVRFVRSASAPLSRALSDEFEAMTGIPIIQSYGMTEAASQICANPLGGVRKAGSVGVPVGVEVRIASTDSAASFVETTLVGHIEIKGPTVITGYESPGYDDRFDDEGWLRSGDLGYFDEDHYLFIVGRNDDLINRGGEKIYPLEIENVLVGVPGVAVVAVIGESDEVFGQVPVAYVQPDDVAVLNSAKELSELVERLRVSAYEGFSKAYRPTTVKMVAQLPVHATGKIGKGSLREGDVVVVYEEQL